MSRRVLWFIGIGVAILLAAGFWASIFWTSWLAQERNARVVATVAGALQAIIASVAVLGAALWFVTKRLHRVRAELLLAATHRRLTEQATLLHVTVTVKNLGEVCLKPRSGYVKVSRVLPLSDSGLPGRWKDNLTKDETEIQWPVIENRALMFCDPDGKRPGWRFEPRESDSFSLDAIVDSSVQVVRISVFMSELERVDSECREIGWRIDTLYDLHA